MYATVYTCLYYSLHLCVCYSLFLCLLQSIPVCMLVYPCVYASFSLSTLQSIPVYTIVYTFLHGSRTIVTGYLFQKTRYMLKLKLHVSVQNTQTCISYMKLPSSVDHKTKLKHTPLSVTHVLFATTTKKSAPQLNIKCPQGFIRVQTRASVPSALGSWLTDG